MPPDAPDGRTYLDYWTLFCKTCLKRKTEPGELTEKFYKNYMRCLKAYNGSVSFKTYIWRSSLGIIQDYWRDICSKPKIADIESCAEPGVSDDTVLTKEYLHWLLGHLEPRDRAIVVKSSEGYTSKQLAAYMRISGSQVSRRLKKAIQTLKRIDKEQ